MHAMPRVSEKAVCETGVRITSEDGDEVIIAPQFHIKSNRFYRYIYLCKDSKIQGPFRPDSAEINKYSKHVQSLLAELNVLYELGMAVEIMKEITAVFIGARHASKLLNIINGDGIHSLDDVKQSIEQYLRGEINQYDRIVLELMLLNGILATNKPREAVIMPQYFSTKALSAIDSNTISKIADSVKLEANKDPLSLALIDIVSEMIHGADSVNYSVYRSMVSIMCSGSVCIQAIPLIEDVRPYDITVKVLSNTTKLTLRVEKCNNQNLHSRFLCTSDVISSIKNAFINYALLHEIGDAKLKMLSLALSIVEKNGLVVEVIKRNKDKAVAVLDSARRRFSV